jgi:hypothetical protein
MDLELSRGGRSGGQKEFQNSGEVVLGSTEGMGTRLDLSGDRVGPDRSFKEGPRPWLKEGGPGWYPEQLRGADTGMYRWVYVFGARSPTPFYACPDTSRMVNDLLH